MRIDYTVIRNSDRIIELELATADGEPVDLAGSVVDFIVDGLFEVQATADVSAGDAIVELVPEDTADAPDTRRAYPYNVKVTAGSGEVTFPQRGLFIVLPDVEA
jgi:hypothetical protein